MTHVLFFAALLALPLFGLWTLRWTRELDLPGRLAVAGAAGAVTLAVAMCAMSLVRVPWTRWTLGAILVIALLGGGRPGRPWRARRPPPFILAFLALTCYGILTARESAGDLHFFWGPKAIHFADARDIDVPFLANRANPNADYPPLLPVVYAWCTIVAGDFSWWAAVLSGALFLFGCVALVRGFTGDDTGALLLAATLAWCFAVGYAPGGADPPLLFFETLALCALTFRHGEGSETLPVQPAGRRRSSDGNAAVPAAGQAASRRLGADILASIGLAGAALTKVEGTTFVIAVILAMLILRRKRALLIAAPALLLIAAWLVFVLANGLLGGYDSAKKGIHLGALPEILGLVWESAKYRIAALPWIVPLVLLAWRRAALPLLVALLTLGAAVFFYLHTADPAWWIRASASRVLLTPLTALLLASLAAPSGRVADVDRVADKAQAS